MFMTLDCPQELKTLRRMGASAGGHREYLKVCSISDGNQVEMVGNSRVSSNGRVAVPRPPWASRESDDAQLEERRDAAAEEAAGM
eukprot:COSAG02_NODE_1818_length_10774_cov_4.788009_6_plen_85_part_00